MSDAGQQPDPTPDPKEQMRAALDAKRAANHSNAAGGAQHTKTSGGPHGKQGGKREFRRKSGG